MYMIRRSIAIFLIILAVSGASARQAGDRLFGQTREEFAARRAAVRSAVKDGVILLFAKADNDDVGRVRYRTDDNIMYLTGVESPRAVLALLPDGDPSGKREILFLPAQSAFSRRWVDPVPGPDEETRKCTGMEAVEDSKKLWERVTPSI